MSALVLALLLQAAPGAAPEASAEPIVENATGWVRDEAGILGEDVVERLNGLLAGHEKATSNQVVVLTVASLDGDAVDAVALRRATELKIGQKGRDNGVLLLIAPNERKLRIEVGYGLEGVLPDARAAQIVRYEILPRFKDGDMAGGIEAGVRAILAAIDGTYAPSAGVRLQSQLDRVRFLPEADFKGQFLTGFFGGLGVFILGALLWGKQPHWSRIPRTLVGAAIPFVVISANYPIALLGFGLFLIVVLWGFYGPQGSGGSGGSSYSSSGYSSGSSWSSSSSSSSSSFSGGGGSFGGGGASGSW